MARRKQDLSVVSIILLGALAAVIGYFVKGNKPGDSPSVSIPTPVDGVDLPRTKDTIRIASFNIQHFSRKKLDRADVLKVLSRTVAQFDIVAIQEIREKDQSLLRNFVKAVRGQGRDLDYEVGPRLGRTSSKEQFAFLWDRSRIDILTMPPSYTANDPGRDSLHREPFVARFAVKSANGKQPFTFALVNVHTDPDESAEEVVALHRVFRDVQYRMRDVGEDDVIMLGDFNERIGDYYEAGKKRVRYLSGTGLEIRGARYVVTGKTGTMLRGKNQNDNIVFSSDNTAEYTGRWGVYDFRKAFRLEQKAALKVSDHFPIWGEFSIEER